MSDSAIGVAAEQPQNQIALIEIEPGVAVLFADTPPTDTDLMQFDMLGGAAKKQLVDRLALLVGSANVAAQFGPALLAAQGIVQLAPETVAMMKVAHPIVKDGWNLGTLMLNGKLAHQVRWLPVGGAAGQGAGPASMGPMLGPAAALLALSAQLASISRKVDENIELTQDVLRAIHEDQWATLKGLYDTTTRAVREAQVVGTVTDHIFQPLAAQEAALRKQRHLFAGSVSTHVSAMRDTSKESREYLRENAQQMLADAHGLVMAEGSWYRYQVLRAANISADDQSLEANQKLLAEVVRDTKDDHELAMNDLEELLGTLERRCRLLAEIPRDRALPFIGRRLDARELAQKASTLAELVAQLRNRERTASIHPNPTITVFQSDVPEEVIRILEWALPTPEEVLAIADCNFDKALANNAYMVVTPRHLYLTGQDALRKQGAIEQSYILDDIRYVRAVDRAKQGPALDVITKDENVRVTFDGWVGKSSHGQESVGKLANLLKTAMNLPEEEKGSDPLLALPAGDSAPQLTAGGTS